MRQGLLLAAVLLTASTPARARESSPSELAAQAAARGDVKEARRLLGQLLGKDFGDARALFVQACVELEAGNLSVASGITAKLKRLRPETVEPYLLEAILARRQGAPAEPWLDTFRVGWKEAGAPSRVDAGLLPREALLKLPLGDAELALSDETAEGFLLQFGERYRPEALLPRARILALTGSPEVRMVALAVLGSRDLSGEERAAEEPLLRSGLAKLAVDEPDNALFAIAALLEGTDASTPLTGFEVLLLEGRLARRVVALPLGRLFDAFERAYAVVDPGQAAPRAYAAALRALPSPGTKLFQRLLATIDREEGEARYRAIGLLHLLGEKLNEGTTLLERMAAAAALARAGAALADRDPEIAEASEARQRRTLELLEAGGKFNRQFSRWPIAGLQRELTRAAAHGEARLFEKLAE